MRLKIEINSQKKKIHCQDDCSEINEQISDVFIELKKDESYENVSHK